MAAPYDTSPHRRPAPPRGLPRPDHLLSFLRVASSAARKAVRCAHTAELQQLTAEVQARRGPG